MFKAYKYVDVHRYFENAYYMIFQHLHCFPTLKSKCPKGRFVALRLIYDLHGRVDAKILYDSVLE